MRVPEHIGMIPDGNRRWAVQHGFTNDNVKRPTERRSAFTTRQTFGKGGLKSTFSSITAGSGI